MKFMKLAQQLAAELSKQFGSDETIFNPQMRRGDDWITLELYRNEEEPDRLHAIVNFDTCGNILLQTEKTLQ